MMLPIYHYTGEQGPIMAVQVCSDFEKALKRFKTALKQLRQNGRVFLVSPSGHFVHAAYRNSFEISRNRARSLIDNANMRASGN